MATSDFPPLQMIVEKGPRLAPATPADAERLDTWRVKSKVSVQFVRSGSRPMERKWFAVLGLVVDKCDVPWTTKEQASQAVKLALGLVDYAKTIHGKYMQWPRSLTELTDPELDDAVRDMMDLIHKMTGIDPETLTKESADVGHEDHHDADRPAASGEGSGERSSPLDDPAPDQSAAADREGDDKEQSKTSPSDLTDEEKRWLVTLAAVIAAVMKEGSERDVVDASKGHQREGLSKLASGKARSIINYAGQVARKEIDFADGLEIIAGVAGCDPKEIKP